MIHALKYEGWAELAEPMATRMARVALGLNSPLIVPVPTTPQRVRDRGYNQAGLLALAYGRGTGRPVVEALIRRDSGPSQVALQPLERSANVRSAFGLNPQHGAGGSGLFALQGAHVVLIDDVLTTGATSQAAARVLLEAGAAEVVVLTFARALVSTET
jgi:ComF family protein